jgi:hypothetical protein
MFPNGFEHLSRKELILALFGIDITSLTDNMYKGYVFALYLETGSGSA